MKLKQAVLKGTVTVLAIACIIFIWIYWYKEYSNPQMPSEFVGILLFVAFVLTIVTLIVWSGLILGPNKSKKSN